jgi:NAD(P)H-flavin reductase
MGGGLVEVTLEVAGEAASSYHIPGQYTQLSLGAAPAERAYFVIAQPLASDAPDATKTCWRFVIKPDGVVATALARGQGSFATTQALGAGFDLAAQDDTDVVVAVGGSGFSIAPSLLAHRIARGLATQTTFLIGTTRADDPPGPDELRAAAAAGVRVVVCSTSDGPGDRSPAQEPWQRHHGFPHEWLMHTPLHRDVIVFAAGPRAMLDAVEALTRTDMPRNVQADPAAHASQVQGRGRVRELRRNA